jgi:DNA-binding CsgD family transcriptional regulator
MLKPSSYMFDNTRPVVITGGDGTVIAQNKPARRVLGPGTGKYCWDVVGKLENAQRLPCRRGCVAELLASGVESKDTEYKLGGTQQRLSCRPVNGVVVCILGPACMLGSENRASSRFLPSLSSREREILLMLADGETTSSTADRLGVCESTIRTHVERMRSKLCVNTRAAVVAEGFRLGYLD